MNALNFGRVHTEAHDGNKVEGASQKPSGSRFLTQWIKVVVGTGFWVASVVAEPGDAPSFAYLLHCAGCHLENGAGDPPDIPDLRVEFGQLLDNAKGRDYVVRVPGIADAPIEASEMAAMLNWMTRQFYPTLEFEPFTEDEVLAGRAKPLFDPISLRRRLLLELGIAETGAQ
jgi:hypothetical protein